MPRVPRLVLALPVNSPEARGPSTPPAPPPAALQAQREPEGLEDQAHVPALARALVLERLVQAASADLHVPVAHLHQQARPHARRVPHPEAVADARSSIPRLKKAR
jgi:hypothetical protein